MRSEIWLCIAVLFAVSVFLIAPPFSVTGRVSDIPSERVVVILKPEMPSNAITGAAVADDSSIEELQEITAAVQQEVLEDVNSPGPVEEAIGVGPTGDVQPERTLETIPAMVVEATPEGIEKLKDHPLVEAVYSDIAFSLSLSESVPLINADDVQQIIVNDQPLTGQGMAACIIDTGIQANHPAFQSRVVAQKCYCTPNCCPNGLSEDTVATDSHPLSHGTHVSGIIGAAGSYVGVAPGADIVAVKVCSTSCQLSDIIAGIDYCITNAGTYDIKVISGSLGDSGNYQTQSACPTYFDSGIDAAYATGIASVFASGNNGYTSGVSYPACSPNAIAVGATDKMDNMASFTNRGSLLEVLAPGVSITSTKSGSTYGALTGTSQATPHVSGAVLLLQQYSSLITGPSSFTPDEIKDALIATGVPIGGYPRIDLMAALEYIGYENATNSSPALNISIISPEPNSTLSTDGTLLSANVSGNTSSATVAWSSNISGILGIGASIAVNLTPGSHLITATATNGNQSASANVSVNVIAPDAPLNITITSPSNNATVYSNGTTLISSVTGNSSNATVVWTSNISGVLGTGDSITVNLSVGTHTITAMVSEGNESASYSITLNAIYPPLVVTVSILSPAPNATLLSNGTGLSASSSPEGTIAWSSNISGSLGAGANITVNLSSGLHKLTAISTVNGSSGNSSVNVSVISATCVMDIDLNGNDDADVGDMVLLLTAYSSNSTSCTSPSSGECVVDLDQNDDNVFNTGDIIVLLTDIIKGVLKDIFGASC